MPPPDICPSSGLVGSVALIHSAVDDDGDDIIGDGGDEAHDGAHACSYAYQAYSSHQYSHHNVFACTSWQFCTWTFNLAQNYLGEAYPFLIRKDVP